MRQQEGAIVKGRRQKAEGRKLGEGGVWLCHAFGKRALLEISAFLAFGFEASEVSEVSEAIAPVA